MGYKFEKIETKIHKWEITSVRFPFSSVESALRIRKEKSCIFCGKKYKDCEALGVVMTNKGSKLCCDDCSDKFQRALANVLLRRHSGKQCDF